MTNKTCSFDTSCPSPAWGYDGSCEFHSWVVQSNAAAAISAAHASGDTQATLDACSLDATHPLLNNSARTSLFSLALTLHYRDRSSVYAVEEATRLFPNVLDSLARDVARFAEERGLAGPVQRFHG